MFVIGLPRLLPEEKPWWAAALGIGSVTYGIMMIRIFSATTEVTGRARRAMLLYGVAATSMGMGMLLWLAELETATTAAAVVGSVAFLSYLWLRLRSHEGD
jgi:drug/metabolite transporter (DMT)-like permease